MIILTYSLIYLSNSLIGDKKHELNVPLEFITFAQVESKMYWHYQQKDSFLLPHGKRTWGNTVAYGALFLLSNYEFYIRQLDAYHACSLSSLGKNHQLDVHHRIKASATQISFDTVDQFERLLYVEKETFPCYMYIGNVKHPKINQRLNKVHSNRILDGVHKQPFKQLIREVITNDDI